jgi:DNA-binding GntR family transcriptional regulator
MLKILKVPNLTDMAYLSVKQHLLNGALVEGARLTEESLATQLGISKSPVREALNRLESEGLVCIEARRGAFVRKFSIREVRDIYDLRELLEVHAIGIAKITPTLLRELADSVQRTRNHLEAGDKLAHVDEDIRFHGLIAAATENAEFARVFENVQQKSLLIRSKSYYLSGSTAPVSHQNIYEALCADDRPRAQDAMREHILYVRDTLLASLESDGDATENEWEDRVVASRV